jgi:hypothetical protein
MSFEHQPQAPETLNTPEHQSEIDKLGAERLNILEREKSAENNIENDPDKRAEQARETIKQHEAPTEKPAAETVQPKLHHRLNHALNFKQTMSSLQRRLSPASRSFSKVIHNPAVEKTSESLEKTVMRPSVINGALWTAVVVQGFLYFTARHYGFALSGAEIIISLLTGALLGIVLEGIWHSIKNR